MSKSFWKCDANMQHYVHYVNFVSFICQQYLARKLAKYLKNIVEVLDVEVPLIKYEFINTLLNMMSQLFF